MNHSRTSVSGTTGTLSIAWLARYGWLACRTRSSSAPPEASLDASGTAAARSAPITSSTGVARDSSSTRHWLPASIGISGTPAAAKCALRPGVTIPPSHGPQPIALTRQLSPRRWCSAIATLFRISFAIA